MRSPAKAEQKQAEQKQAEALAQSGVGTLRREPASLQEAVAELRKAMHDQKHELNQAVDGLQRQLPRDQLSLVVFSGELDKLLAALVIATGAAASGMHVRLFFTFWGTTALRRKVKTKKDFWGRMFGWLLPRGTQKVELSRMNFGGAGTWAMKHLMKRKGVASLEELLELAADLEVHIDVCTMSMDLMGIGREEIIDYPHLGYCGVASFVDFASQSRTSLFI